MSFVSPHTYHFFSANSSHLQFPLFISRHSPVRCLCCRRQSFLFEFGYLREIVPGLEHLVPFVDIESDVDFESFIWSRFYLRLFCVNQSCEFEGSVVFCTTPSELADRLVELGRLAEVFNLPFANTWQAEIASTLHSHEALFFGEHCHEDDLAPSLVLELTLFSDNVSEIPSEPTPSLTV